MIKSDASEAFEPYRVLILDLECTCDEPNFPDGEMEIIELGAVIVSLSSQALEIIDSRSFIVRPETHRLLSDFCCHLTGITQEQVDLADPLKEVLARFEAWVFPHSIKGWGSWGKFDLKQMDRESQLKELVHPLVAVRHENIKARYAKRYKYQMGLKPAVEHSGLTFQGRHHSGIDDALNIANILTHRKELRQDWCVRIMHSIINPHKHS